MARHVVHSCWVRVRQKMRFLHNIYVFRFTLFCEWNAKSCLVHSKRNEKRGTEWITTEMWDRGKRKSCFADIVYLLYAYTSYWFKSTTILAYGLAHEQNHKLYAIASQTVKHCRKREKQTHKSNRIRMYYMQNWHTTCIMFIISLNFSRLHIRFRFRFTFSLMLTQTYSAHKSWNGWVEGTVPIA